jgi:hypothetical protein
MTATSATTPMSAGAPAGRALALACRPLPLLVLALALRLPALLTRYSFSADETIYSALAVRILHGHDLYAGAVDHKPVGIDLFYAAVYWLVGRNHLVAIHLLLIAIVWLTALVLRRIAARTCGSSAAGLAGLFYVCASAAALPADGQAANTELILNLPIALAAWLVCDVVARADEPGRAADRRLAPLVAAGVLTGVAGLFKYQAALAGGAWAIAVTYRAAPAAAIRRLAALAVGFAAVAGALSAFFYLRGEWQAFAFWGWRYNFSYIDTLTIGEKVHHFLARTPVMALFWLPLLLPAILGIGTRFRDEGGAALQLDAASTLVAAWFALDWLAITLGGRFYLYYFQLLLPPLTIAAALGAAPLFARSRAWRRTILALGGASLAIAMTVAWGQKFFQPALVRDRNREIAAGEWVRAHSSPEETLFVWGSSSQIYYFADRPMATRFAFCNYQTGKIWGSWAAAVDAGDTSAFVVPQSWPELLDDLDREPPAFIVDAAAGGLAMFDRHPLTRYRELATRVGRDYRMAAVVDGIPIYERHVR